MNEWRTGTEDSPKKKIKSEIKDMKKEVEENVKEQIIFLDAEKARLFANICVRDKSWDIASTWWASAVIGYANDNKYH